MKKKNLLLTLTVFILLIFLINGVLALEYDDFEDNNYNSPAGRVPTWRIAAGASADITSQGVTKYAGSYALQVKNVVALTTIRGTPSDNNYYGWMYPSTGLSQIGIMKDTNAQAFSIVTYISGVGPAIAVACDVGSNNVGYISNLTHWHRVAITYVADSANANIKIYDANGDLVGDNTIAVACAFTPATLRLQEGAGTNVFFDNIFYVGVPPAPAYGIDANFSYTLNKSVSTIDFNDISTDTNVLINDWNWLIDGVKVSDDQNFVYVGTQNVDYNACLNVGGLGGDGNTYIDQLCRTVNLDTLGPSIDGNITFTQGFGSNFNATIRMRCIDPNSANLTYSVVKNDSNTLYSSYDANASQAVVAFGLSINRNTFRLTCTDNGLNTATLDLNAVYGINLRLVNEDTGAQLTCPDLNKFNSVKAYTTDGNYSIDYNAPCTGLNTFVGNSNAVVFEIGYLNNTVAKIFRYIDFGSLNDYNAGVCVPDNQTFFLQQFTSGQARQIQLYNNIAHCYDLAGTLAYASTTQYVQNVYTVVKPYQLYAWLDGVKVALIGIDGSQANQFNLDTIIFSRQPYNYQTSQDTIVFQQKLNSITQKYDLNIVQILYKSYLQNNTAFSVTISLNDTTYFNYSDTNSPNNEIVEMYWGSIPGVSDQNWFKLVIVLTKTDGTTETITKYLNIVGQERTLFLNPWVAIIVSLLFFLFGISLASVGRTFGLFGAIIILVSCAIAALAIQFWYVQLLEVGYIICLFFIFFMGKPQIPVGGME